MNYKIVFLDIDGTILTKDHEIQNSTKVAINKLKEKGIEVVLATGRANMEIKEVADSLQINSFITYNGSYVNFKEKEIYKNVIDPSIVEEYLAVIKKESKLAASCYGLDSAYITDETHPITVEAYQHYDIDANNPENDYSIIGDVYKMILYAYTKEELMNIQKQFTEIKFVPWNSLYSCADVLPKTGSKAEGIKHMLEYLNIPKEQAIAFGDGENDIEMLSYVGMGIAMGNAHPSLPQHAKFQTTSSSEDGIYNGLKKIGVI